MAVDRIIIGDRYELMELAGQGGMATVWRGVMHGAAGFSRKVAVKKIKPEFHAIQNYIDMFIEEARVGSDLAHPNIVQIHDFIIDEEGSYYLVMEWVEGLDLGTFARAFRADALPVPWQLMAALAVGALRGLGAAHDRRRADGSVAPVIHRDVSPQNILIGINGIVKLTDFGLARARDRAYSLTAPGTVKGKLSYLAPEVTYGKDATPLSDIFSMGNVMWEALAGHKLFQGNTDLDVFKKIRACEVPELAALRPDIPAAFTTIVQRSLAREPGDRFASARIMARAIVEVLKDVVWREDAHTELGEMVSRIRLGRSIRNSDIMKAVAGPGFELDGEAPADGSDSSPSQPRGPALLSADGVEVEFTEPSARGKAGVKAGRKRGRSRSGQPGTPGGDGAGRASPAVHSDASGSVDIEFTDPEIAAGQHTDDDKPG